MPSKITLSKLLATLVTHAKPYGPVAVAKGKKEYGLSVEIHRANEVRLEASFRIYECKSGGFGIATHIYLRWQRAEELCRDIRMTIKPPIQLPPSGHGARAQLYAITMLAISNDPAYFDTRDTIVLAQNDVSEAISFVTRRLFDCRDKVVPAFSHYCDTEHLAAAATKETSESKLMMLPHNTAAILACAGQWKAFHTWNDVVCAQYRSRQTEPDVIDRYTDFCAMIEERLVGGTMGEA